MTKKGLFKRLKNIENAQRKLNNSDDNNSEYFTFKSQIDSKFNEHKDEDEGENEKTERDLYQGCIEGMKGLKLPDEIESKDEKSQMYLENNLNKIRNNFPNIYDKYQRIFKHTADKEKSSIDYKMLSSKVKGIIFFDFLTVMILCTIIQIICSSLVQNKLQKKINHFWKVHQKYVSLKRPLLPLKGGINNTEKAYDDLVLSINKTSDDVFY